MRISDWSSDVCSSDLLLAKATEKGIACSEQMSDAEAWQLIFAPGFSTAAQVTDVSGRGVGMDVVKKNIQALGGSVELARSEERRGGKGGGRTCRSRGSPDHGNKKKTQ